jgi:hypothetical protein
VIELVACKSCKLFFSLKYMKEQKEPQDKQPDELEEIREELRLYGDEAVGDDSAWDMGRYEEF